MAGIVDTNILLYAANIDADKTTGSRSFLTRAAESADQWYLTEGILYEFLRVATHARVFDRPLTWREALDFLGPFLASPVSRSSSSPWQKYDPPLQGLSPFLAPS